MWFYTRSVSKRGSGVQISKLAKLAILKIVPKRRPILKYERPTLEITYANGSTSSALRLAIKW
jgi:hypothetical protein